MQGGILRSWLPQEGNNSVSSRRAPSICQASLVAQVNKASRTPGRLAFSCCSFQQRTSAYCKPTCVLRVGRRPYFTRLLSSHRQVGLSDLTTPEEVNAIILAEEGAVVAFISRAYEVSTRPAYGDRPRAFHRLSYTTSITVPDDLRIGPPAAQNLSPKSTSEFVDHPCVGNWRYRLISQHRNFSNANPEGLVACPVTTVQHASCCEFSPTQTTASQPGEHNARTPCKMLSKREANNAHYIWYEV